MVINSHEPAKDRNKQNRENKNRVKKVIDTGKEKGITLETPKTEEQKVSVKKEGDGAEAPKKKKNIIRVYHAQNASDGGRTERNQLERENHVHRAHVLQHRHSRQRKRRHL